jgi:hypothetical protein
MSGSDAKTKILMGLVAALALALVVFVFLSGRQQSVTSSPAERSERKVETPESRVLDNEGEATRNPTTVASPVPEEIPRTPGVSEGRLVRYCVENAKQFETLGYGKPPDEPAPHSLVTSILTSLAEGRAQVEGMLSKEDIYYYCRIFADRAPISEEERDSIRQALEGLRSQIEYTTVTVRNRSGLEIRRGSTVVAPGREGTFAGVEIVGAWYPGCGAAFEVEIGGMPMSLPFHIKGDSRTSPPVPGREATVQWSRFTVGRNAGQYLLEVVSAMAP